MRLARWACWVVVSGLVGLTGCGEDDVDRDPGGGGGTPTGTTTGTGTGTGTGTSSGTPTGTSTGTSTGAAPDVALGPCFAACGTASPDGSASYASRTQSCACGFCAAACTEACSSGTLDATCAGQCVHGAINMGICSAEREACWGDPACSDYYGCIQRCLTPTTQGEVPIDQLRQMCVGRINAYRELEGRAALAPRTDQEACTDAAAAMDAASGVPHSSYGTCGESSQCECIGINPADGGSMFMLCLEMMYMEKFTGEQGQGHYLAMVNEAFTSVACGFSGSWGTQNYY